MSEVEGIALSVSNSRAKLYHENRLRYAEGTGAEILRLAGIGQGVSVVELGSGTGLLTQQLAELCTLTVILI